MPDTDLEALIATASSSGLSPNAASRAPLRAHPSRRLPRHLLEGDAEPLVERHHRFRVPHDNVDLVEQWPLGHAGNARGWEC